MLERLIVEPGTPAALAGRDTADTLGLTGKVEAKEELRDLHDELSKLQTRLWAEHRRSVLLVLQGVDASGKDGTIRSVFSGVSPLGCRVISFRRPTEIELAHDFLWRVHAACPARGEIGIFNRSHYEDVVTVRVHEIFPEQVWRPRLEHIRTFERLLTAEGTTVVKCFLHLSKEEQRKELEERLADPEKRWKFNPEDLETRERWDELQVAYDETLTETSIDEAPWHVVPADRAWVRNLAVATVLVATLRRLDPRFPDPQLDAVKIA